MRRGRHDFGQNPPGTEVFALVQPARQMPFSSEAHSMVLLAGNVIRAEVSFVHDSLAESMLLALERMGMQR